LSEGCKLFFPGRAGFRHKEVKAERIGKMNRAERISREAEQMAFEYRQLFTEGKEPSEADVMLFRVASLLSELALYVRVAETVQKVEELKKTKPAEQAAGNERASQ
jgi:hypothetical protein